MDNSQNEYNNNNTYYETTVTREYNQQNNNCIPQQLDKVSVGFCILGWFIPLFALIYFLTKKSEKPKCAKAVGICGLVSFILNMIFTIIAFAFTGSVLNKSLDLVDTVVDNGFVEEIKDEAGFDDFVASYGGTEENDDKTSTSKTSSNWKDYKVIVNGTEIQLPIKYSEFAEKTGYKFKEIDDGKQTLKKNNTATETIGYNDNSLMVSFVNYDEMTTLDNCYITSISLYDFNNNVKFVNDLTVGAKITKEEIIKSFGEPDYVYDDDNYHRLQYKETDNVYNDFDITIQDNMIVGISTECVDIK